jgi:serine/threonine protein phosphatase PrpC
VIYKYGITAQGADHIKRGIECQDAHRIIQPAPQYCIAAVADGLGSELYSGTASRIAVDTSLQYCNDNIAATMNHAEIEEIIHVSFIEAQNAILKKAAEDKGEIDQYDTTLSLAVFIDNTLHFGHSGDSGIIALTLDGSYEKVTEQQRDENGYVFPLCFEDKWVFGTYDKKIAAVVLATDGIYETFFPVYIRAEPVCIHIALISYFLDNTKLRIDELGEDKIKESREKYINKIPGNQVTDDKTIVCLINTGTPPARQNSKYYEEPDWKELKHKWNIDWKKKAYRSDIK